MTNSNYRIEITFVGEAPANELARARILGSEAVHEKIAELRKVLAEAGLPVEVTAQSIRATPKRPRTVAPLPHRAAE